MVHNEHYAIAKPIIKWRSLSLPVTPYVTAERSAHVEPIEHATANRLRILAIGTEWASGQGGLSTFNRQLCLALANVRVDVSCVVINATSPQIDEARRSGVRLFSATRTTGVDEREWLARRPVGLGTDYVPDFIIGHGRITGPAALRLAEDFFPGTKRLHFVHMAPDEIEWYKLDRVVSAGLRAEERTRQELDLGRTAYRVVAVGPRLHDRYSRDLFPFGVPAPIRFDPGFDAKEGGPAGPPPRGPWKVLLQGRGEDYWLKGMDLAARALGILAHARCGKWPEIEFVVRGAKPGNVDELRQQLLAWANSPRLQVVVRAWTTKDESLDHDVGTSSLLLMPSRREGFGLVGLEAIAAGVPVLVSSGSGLAQMLKETLDHKQAARVIVETTGDEISPQADVHQWGRAIGATLRNREAAFRRAAELRDALAARHTWRASVLSLLSGL
jgi:glycosyltransferase involved in cell wall biosynthesis